MTKCTRKLFPVIMDKGVDVVEAEMEEIEDRAVKSTIHTLEEYIITHMGITHTVVIATLRDRIIIIQLHLPI